MNNIIVKLISHLESHYGKITQPGGHCLAAVEKALESALNHQITNVPSAYLADTVLATDAVFLKIFKKIRFTKHSKVPLGSVCIYNKTAGHPHGHIEVKVKHPNTYISDYKQFSREKYTGQNPMIVYAPIE